MSGAPPPFSAAPDGARVAVRVTPRAARAGYAGTGVDAAGRAFLKLRVNAPAEGGKANAAAIKLLAKLWGLPPSRLSIAAGAKDRRKTVHVAGDPSALIAQLSRWIETQDNA
ncbi:MAG: DUF167 domain-containing protein [Alphaproteobacteria bacterium]